MKLGAFASWAASWVGRGLAVAVPGHRGPQLPAAAASPLRAWAWITAPPCSGLPLPGELPYVTFRRGPIP